MALSKSYLSVNGELYAEWTEGTSKTEVGYIRDALGNVMETVNGDGNTLNTYNYKPFGDVLSKTGSAPDPKYLWCGTWGYRASGTKRVSHYVRARHYSFADAAWITIDPLWPSEMPYGYVEGRVMTGVDYWGTCIVVWKSVSDQKLFCHVNSYGGVNISKPNWTGRTITSDVKDSGHGKTADGSPCDGCRAICSMSVRTSVTVTYKPGLPGKPYNVKIDKAIHGDCAEFPNEEVAQIVTAVVGMIPIIGGFIAGGFDFIQGIAGLVGKAKPVVPPVPSFISKKCSGAHGFNFTTTTESFMIKYDCSECNKARQATPPCKLYPPSTHSEPGAIVPKPGGGVIRT